MNETANTMKSTDSERPAAGGRPVFSIFHPNAKGTGCALMMELHPAHDLKDGSIMTCFMNQKTVGDRRGPIPTYSTFDTENKIWVKLDFFDLAKILQVFRGECESLEGGKGLFHQSARYSTHIRLQHQTEVANGYLFEVYRTTPGKRDGDVSACITLASWEAMGLALAIENSFGVICFGIPQVVAHDTSAYEAAARKAIHANAA